MNTIDTNTKTVKVTHKTRCKDTAVALKGEENPCKTFNTVFDFSDCTESEVLELASKTCIIAFRTKSKVNSITEDEFQALQDEPINVHEAMKAERRGLSSEQKIENAIDKMSDADRAALLERLINKRS